MTVQRTIASGLAAVLLSTTAAFAVTDGSSMPILSADDQLRQARLGMAALAVASEGDRDFYLGKRHACDFFFRHELPPVLASAGLLRAGDDTLLAMQPAQF